MNEMEALRLQIALQIAWGADEFLLEKAQDRRLAVKPVAKEPDVLPAAAQARPVGVTGAVTTRNFIGTAGPAEAGKIAAACETLEALKAALDAFNGCTLRDTATQLVFADGAETSKVMLIGEAPGAEEDRTGRPFVGLAGQLLDRMLASIGLDRTIVRIVNVVPWRPPGNRAPTDSEIAVCLPFLQRHIALIGPAILVLLGGTASKAMLSGAERNTGIRKLRGNWQSIAIPGLEAEIPCLPTYHPAYLLRMAAAKRESWLDLIALRERLQTGF
jgi:DNA polymerase